MTNLDYSPIDSNSSIMGNNKSYNARYRRFRGGFAESTSPSVLSPASVNSRRRRRRGGNSPFINPSSKSRRRRGGGSKKYRR